MALKTRFNAVAKIAPTTLVSIPRDGVSNTPRLEIATIAVSFVFYKPFGARSRFSSSLPFGCPLLFDGSKSIFLLLLWSKEDLLLSTYLAIKLTIILTMPLSTKRRRLCEKLSYRGILDFPNYYPVRTPFGCIPIFPKYQEGMRAIALSLLLSISLQCILAKAI